MSRETMGFTCGLAAPASGRSKAVVWRKVVPVVVNDFVAVCANPWLAARGRKSSVSAATIGLGVGCVRRRRGQASKDQMRIETEQRQKQKAIVVGAEDEKSPVDLLGKFSVCWWRWYKLD